MRAAGQADCFVIVNGPEDGTEYPVVRAPFYIGSHSSCPVQIRLDTDIEDHHALITVVSDGYRVRKTDRKPVLVDGKQAGSLRSRIVRNGGTIQVGSTLIAVDCSPDGLARRSRGIVYESDFGWAAQRGMKNAVHLVRRGVSFAFDLFRRILTSWLAILSILILLMVFWPAFRNWVMSWIRYAYWVVTSGF